MVIAVAMGMVASFAVAACGGDTMIGTTGPGGSNSSGGASGTTGLGAAGGLKGNSGARTTVDSGYCSLPPSRKMGTEGSECCSDGDCYVYPAFCKLPAACINGRCGPCEQASGGGSGGPIGAGGSTATDASSVSSGKASIEFTVTGRDSYCGPGCPAPAISIMDSEGRTLTLEEGCQTDCRTCLPAPCIYCPAIGVAITDVKLDWDGTVYVASACGAGNACAKSRFAPPGRYTATFCATPGKLTGPDGGIQQCVNTGPSKCGSVEFDFPSTTVVKGTVGP